MCRDIGLTPEHLEIDDNNPTKSNKLSSFFTYTKMELYLNLKYSSLQMSSPYKNCLTC